MDKETKEKEFQVIVKPSIARQLLKLGHMVVDFKPNKEDRNATVFVFLNTADFIKDWEEIKRVKKNKTE